MYNYLFDISPSTNFEYIELAFGLVGLMLLFSIIMPIIKKKLNNNILNKSTKHCSKIAFIFAVIMIILIISRIAGLQYVSMRFNWVLLFVIGFGFDMFYTLKYLKLRKKEARYLKTKKKDISSYKKYLPKKKK